jgi:hypothetical protein
MQDISTIEQSLHGIAAAFKDGGLYFLIGVCVFLVYKAALALIKGHKASQEVNVTMPAADVNGGASGNPLTVVREHEGRISRVEGVIVTLTTSIETVRTENREDHQQLFSAIEHIRKP